MLSALFHFVQIKRKILFCEGELWDVYAKKNVNPGGEKGRKKREKYMKIMQRIFFKSYRDLIIS